MSYYCYDHWSVVSSEGFDASMISILISASHGEYQCAHLTCSASVSASVDWEYNCTYATGLVGLENSLC